MEVMLFHTWTFLVFLIVVYCVYLIVRKINLLMIILLMIASYTFYGFWNTTFYRGSLPTFLYHLIVNPYLLLLFGTSAIDYLMVLFMERSQSQRTRKLWLIISLVSNFGFLGYFKYSGFFTENINALLISLGSSL